MTSPVRRPQYAYTEYIALEEGSSIRHEYLNGEIYAMGGGSPDHAALAATVIGLLGARLPPGCRIFTSDLRIRIPNGLSTYPDAAVVCGRTERAADDPLAVVNPVLLIEITSKSTEPYDRGEKLRHYAHLRSVREVLIVSHREPWLTLHRRDDAEFGTPLEARRGDSLMLESLAARLSVDDVYGDDLEDAGR